MIKLIVTVTVTTLALTLAMFLMAGVVCFVIWEMEPLIVLLQAPAGAFRVWLVFCALLGVAWHYSD